MSTREIIEKLSAVNTLFREGRLREAKEVFLRLELVDSREHLALPPKLRSLIWQLYEYLVVGDTQFVTDKSTLLKELGEFFIEEK